MHAFFAFSANISPPALSPAAFSPPSSKRHGKLPQPDDRASSGLCIAFQFSTFAAESAFGVVLLSAVQRDHLRHHLLFLFPLSGCSIHIYNLSCFYPPGRATSVPARVTCSFCLEASMSAHSPVFCIAAAISSSARFPRCRHSLQSASWIPDGIPARPFYPSALLSVPLKSRPR